MFPGIPKPHAPLVEPRLLQPLTTLPPGEGSWHRRCGPTDLRLFDQRVPRYSPVPQSTSSRPSTLGIVQDRQESRQWPIPIPALELALMVVQGLKSSYDCKLICCAIVLSIEKRESQLSILHYPLGSRAAPWATSRRRQRVEREPFQLYWGPCGVLGSRVGWLRL